MRGCASACFHVIIDMYSMFGVRQDFPPTHRHHSTCGVVMTPPDHHGNNTDGSSHLLQRPRRRRCLAERRVLAARVCQAQAAEADRRDRLGGQGLFGW